VLYLYVFGPSGFGFVIICNESFYHEPKKVRKTLISILFWLFIIENWCKCTFKKY
jgi:hypothetical protein